MARIAKITSLFLLLCWAMPVQSQIVNIERARIQSDSTGWLGNAGASFSLTKNKVQVFAADADAQVQYKSKRSLVLLAGNFGVLKSAGSNLIRQSLLHLRYNYKINSTVRWELFTQWQQNAVTLIDYRFLLGTGPRFKIIGRDKFRCYAGSLLMFESEREKTTAHQLHHDLRNSSYLSFTIIPSPSMELISTTYFQPLLNDFSDYRLLNQVLLRLKAGKYWAIRLDWNYLFDKKPVPGIPKENYKFSTGFDVDL